MGGSLASEHSYTITLSNNRTEKVAIDFVMSRDSSLWSPTASSRKSILAQLGLPASLSRAFDLVQVRQPLSVQDGLQVEEIDAITLIELKTTKKRLPEMPRGFFFGAVQNEFDLAEALGDRYKFCFVCLNKETLGFQLLTLRELRPLIRTKRTQYQINL